MYELGSYEETGHRLVGGRAAQVVNKLITVGQRARWIAEEALAGGMKPADVHPTASNTDAIAVLQGLIRPGDIVLIKGSRAARMETIVDTLSRPRKTGS
jgi:UDP-N-acetylmuramoyl-tripeptide--D-alanyl-D-alanine ligase